MKISKLLKIKGKVQGVSFRDSMRKEAHRLCVSGWVRNCKDGSVDALIQGEEILVLELLKWAKIGPSAAHVISLEEKNMPMDASLTDFLQQSTE